jgi:hypothetical protein
LRNETYEEKKYFKNCDLGVYKDYRCFAKFYEQYTKENGLEKAFSHLAFLNKDFPEYFEACHIITHGIGHAELQNNDGDVAKSLLQVNMQNPLYKNMSTCANGYFHGIIEEYLKDVKDENTLIDKSRLICNESLYDKKSLSEGGCFHGVGHALYLQLDYDWDKSLKLCDSITENKSDRYNCYTGVLMEDIMDSKQEEIFTHIKNDNLYKFNFKRCESLDEIYKPACYMEVSVLFENLSENKNDYSLNISFCKYLANETYKMACIKQMAYRAITNFYMFPGKMCNVLENDNQKIICLATYAYRLAGSINETDEYKQKIWDDICSYANDKKGVCLNLSKKTYILYRTSFEDKEF